MPHKTELERTVLAARVKVSEARDHLDLKPIVVQTMKEQLDKALCILQKLELMVSQKKSSIGSIGQIPRIERAGASDTNRWMLNTFTQYDYDITDINFVLHRSVTESMPVAGFDSSRPVGNAASSSSRPHSSSESLSEGQISDGLPADVAHILEGYMRPSFNFLHFARSLKPNHQLPVFANYVIEAGGGLEPMSNWVSNTSVFQQRYLKYMAEIDRKYDPNVKYHNASHAVDVMATTERLMWTQYMQTQTNVLDRLMALTAAAVHDVGHPGKDSHFQHRTMSRLALRYNDRSVLENMHAAEAFTILKSSPDQNWLPLLVDGVEHHLGVGGESEAQKQHPQKIQQYVRKAIIRMILGTDMLHHEQFMKALSSFVANTNCREELNPQGTGDAVGEAKEEALEHKLFLLEALVHVADLSGMTKPREIMLSVTHRIISEFWEQGEAEARLGLQVSPLCDKAKGMMSVPQNQLGFCLGVVQPLFLKVGDLLPETREWVKELEANIKFWEEKRLQKATYEQIFPGGRASLQMPAGYPE